MGKSNAVIQKSSHRRLREVLTIGKLENFGVSGFWCYAYKRWSLTRGSGTWRFDCTCKILLRFKTTICARLIRKTAKHHPWEVAKKIVETYILLLMQWHETQGKWFRKKHGTLNTLLQIVYSQAFRKWTPKMQRVSGRLRDWGSLLRGVLRGEASLDSSTFWRKCIAYNF